MNSRDFIILLALAAVWGASFLLMRVATPEFGAFALIAIRMGLGGACLLPVFLKKTARDCFAENWARLTFSGLLNTGIPFLLLAYATLKLNAGFTAVLNGAVPFVAASVAFFWFGTSLKRLQLLGMAIGMGGMVVLVWDGLSVGEDSNATSIVCALLACFFYGYGANFMKRYLSQIPPKVASAGSLLGGSLILIPLGIIFRPDQVPTPTAWLSVAILAIVCTGIAFVVFFDLLQRVGPTSAVSVTFMIPAFGVFWGWWLLDEQLSYQLLGGMLLTLSGTALVNRVSFFPMFGKSPR